MFECKICGKELTTFGMPCHLKRTHKIECKDYYDKYIELNTQHLCLMCNKPTNFNSLLLGYRQYCCQDCARRHAIEITKKKYKVSNISQVPEINAKMRKSIKQNWDNLDKEQKDIRCKNISNGTKVGMKKWAIKKEQQVNDYCINNNYVRLSKLIQIYGSGFIQNDILNLNMIQYQHKILISKDDIPKIEEYANIKVRSKHETYLYNLVKLYCPDALQNTRTIIHNRELDIYIPQLKLAIEFNGIYYHSIENGMDKDFHLNKSIECRNYNIRLIHIYQFEDFNKQLALLIDLLEGTDNYPNNDFNKNNLIDTIPQSEIIYKTEKYTIYGAGKLVEC